MNTELDVMNWKHPPVKHWGTPKGSVSARWEFALNASGFDSMCGVIETLERRWYAARYTFTQSVEASTLPGSMGQSVRVVTISRKENK